MNFQQEEQLAGASPHTWLSSTDKMCTTDNLATSSISAPVSIVMGGSGVFLFAGPNLQRPDWKQKNHMSCHNMCQITCPESIMSYGP